MPPDCLAEAHVRKQLWLLSGSDKPEPPSDERGASIATFVMPLSLPAWPAARA